MTKIEPIKVKVIESDPNNFGQMQKLITDFVLLGRKIGRPEKEQEIK